MTQITDNPASGRFEMDIGGTVAFVDYAMRDGTLVLIHTEVPESLSGKGVGSTLAKGVLEEARRRGVKVEPRCEFMAAYIDRHPEFRDLL